MHLTQRNAVRWAFAAAMLSAFGLAACDYSPGRYPPPEPMVNATTGIGDYSSHFYGLYDPRTRDLQGAFNPRANPR